LSSNEIMDSQAMRPRAVFVDDDDVLLRGLRRLLCRKLPDWDLAFMPSGPAALDELARAPADVVISDLSMPEMDGATFLRRVQADHPATARLLMTGHADPSLLGDTTQSCHQWFAKPTEPEVLTETLERVIALHRLVPSTEIRGIVAAHNQLLAEPTVYARLGRLLGSPRAPIADVSRLVASDIGMVARILHMARSARVAHIDPPRRVHDAVVHVGLGMMRALVLEIDIARTFTGKAPAAMLEAMRQRAQRAALLIERMLPDADRGDSFAVGMLHEVGMLVLADRRPQELDEAAAVADEERRPIAKVLHQRLGFGHAEIGGYLLGLWGFSPEVVEAIASHQHASRALADPLSLTGAAYLAHRLAADPDAPVDAEAGDHDEAIAEPFARALGAPLLAAWRAAAREATPAAA
jgi:HD-like signal output (HDOD) protein